MLPKIFDAASEPDSELRKEVHAHFGLCMYFAQVFETELINILTVLETASRRPKSRQEYTAAFDELYTKHEGLTFGNLLQALSKHNVIQPEVMTEAKEMKIKRDHLAHRFFRDHSLDELTVGGCYTMIEKLEQSRDRFIALDQRVTAIGNTVWKACGIDPTWIANETSRMIGEMRKEAIARRSSKLDLE